MNIPIIRVEIESLREQLCQAMALHGEALTEMVQSGVEKALDPDTIQERIDIAVESALNKAIDELADNHTVKSTIQAIINAALRKKRDEIEGARPE